MPGNEIQTILDETENVLCDILLSGCHSVRESSVERLRLLKDAYSDYGMETGADLAGKLAEALISRRASFDYDKLNIADCICVLEFYLRNARSRTE